MDRISELNRYIDLYTDPEYKMGECRFMKLKKHIPDVSGYTWLDVSCGRGELLDYLSSKGFIVKGSEGCATLVDKIRVVKGILPYLPFKDGEFDYVSNTDVLEHLIPEDTIPALKEIKRVGKGKYLIAIGNYPCPWKGSDDTHINIRDDWDKLIMDIFGDYIAYHENDNLLYRIGY